MRKCLWFVLLCIIILAGIFTLPWWVTPKQIERVANHFLAPDYEIQLADKWQVDHQGIQLDYLAIKHSSCTIVNLQSISLQGWLSRNLSVNNSTLDYACLMVLPTSKDTQTSLKTSAILAAIPVDAIRLHHIKLINTAALPKAIRDFSDADLSIDMTNIGKQLSLKADVQHSKLQAIHNSTLSTENAHFLWQGTTEATFSDNQHYQSDFSVQLDDELFQPQPKGQLNLSWENPYLSATKGTVSLSWEGEYGQITALDTITNNTLLDVPFEFTPNGLIINWGTFYWKFDDYQPLKGFIELALHKPENAWLPIGIDLDLLVQTSGEQGKAELAISGKNGEIGGGEQQNQLRVNLITRGELNYNNTVAKTHLTYHLGGHFNDPTIRFQPNSIFEIDYHPSGTNIRAQVPLNNVQASKYGLDGILQATLQGSTPQFDKLDIKLDGEADEFIAGIKTVFQLRDEQDIHKAEKEAQNRWDWKIEGNAFWRSLNTPINIKGVGFWEGDHIELNQLSVLSKHVNIDGVKMAPLSLVLKDRLRWNYENNHIRGLMQAKTDWISFDYGGRFNKPVLGVGIDGKSINNFNLAGDLKAGSLGPVDILAKYENQSLTGKISWKTQSAKIFQSLFPQQWGWLIHNGAIRGASDFQINGNGVTLDGELALTKAMVSLPDGEIQGLSIKMPLHYTHDGLRVFNTKPMNIVVDTMNKGALQLKNMSLDVVGTYPYSNKKPLILKNVNIGLFDGRLHLPNFRIPQNKVATLALQNIDLKQVMDIAQYHQLELTGRINASFPFWLEHPQCLICNGKIEQNTPLRIKLNRELVDGLKKGGVTESILADLLHEMAIDNLRVNVTLSPKGQMDLAAKVKAFNPTKKTHQPITLNYTHKENMFELWQMIDYGSQFEQNLQYQLYQKLEK